MGERIFSTSERNVSEPERWVSVVLGSAVAAYGLKMRSIPGLVLGAVGAALMWRGATGHCVVYESMGLSTVEETGDNVSIPYGKGIGVEKSVTINASPEELYSFWRNLENLPRFMHHLEAVQIHDGKRSHWVAKGPAGTNVHWEAEIINEIPNELLAWRSIDGSEIDNAGSVHFKPAGGATEVKVVLRYDPPAGKVGAKISKLLGEDPASAVQEDLLRLKQLIETGATSATEE